MSPTPDCELLLSSFPSHAQAQACADALVSDHLAACVQIGPAMHSTYRWEGRLEHATEYPLYAKIASDRRDAAIIAIQTCHPYALPEIICLPITAGLPPYLSWVVAETRPPAAPAA